MTQGTQLVVVPNDLQLPAHLRTAEAAAVIAAANAAAAGGIRAASFPRLSKDGAKFHIIDGDNDTVLMNPPAAPGQPATPMMAIRVVIAAGNPALSKLFYKDKKIEGTNVAPTCSSSDGIRPDAHVSTPQAQFCGQCQWNVWGSRISEYSQKKIKACSDDKQVAFFPVDPNGNVDTSKVYGQKFTVSELSEWGQYVGALDAKGVAVSAVITNLSFDLAVSHPKIVASFGGFLAPEQWQAVLAREHDADVKAIVAPVSRAAPAQLPQLPAPPVQPQLPAPVAPPPVQAPPVQPAVPGFGAVAQAPITAVVSASAVQAPPVATVPAAVNPFAAAASAAPVSVGTSTPAAPAAAPEAAKRTRRTRAEIDADNAAKAPVDPRIAHLPVEQRTIIMSTGGPDGSVGAALLAAFPAPLVQQPTTPVQEAVGTAGVATPPAQEQMAAASVPITAPAVTAGAPAPTASNAFGGAAVNTAPPPVSTPAGMDLAAKLQMRLNGGAAFAAPATVQ